MISFISGGEFMNDKLIRNIDKDDMKWLEENTPEGLSQNQFLKSLIKDAREKQEVFPFLRKQENQNKIFGKLPFKFIDLFAGIGGFRSALTALGGDCVFSNEWDKYACLTYRAWYGDDDINSTDIRMLDVKNIIPAHDILCAGFPCQPFSIAGVSKKKSLGRTHGFQDPDQGNLFERIMDIVDLKRPPILFLENVKNLRSHDKGNTWRRINEEIFKRDYFLRAEVINAKYWVPQRRERIYIVCFDRKIFDDRSLRKFSFPKNFAVERILDDVLEKKPDKKYMLSDKLWNYLKNYAAKHKEKGNGFGYGLNTGKDTSRTMSARYYKDGSEILIRQNRWKNPRRLTPWEAKHLMGFNDRFASNFGHAEGFPQVVSDAQAYKQFGNSVIPLVIEEIGIKILDVMAARVQQDKTKGLMHGYKLS